VRAVIAPPVLTHADAVAALAVTALRDEVDLTPKPGLVDRRGPGAHPDMTAELLHASAEALRGAFAECAAAAAELPLGPELRATIGVIGRRGEDTMLATTGGVNTHRGALWAVGLLSAAAGSGAASAGEAAAFAAQLARLPDPAGTTTASTHGARARRRHGVSGAPGEARAGFPHVIDHALPALRAGTAHDALLCLMAHLDDTCLLHRGGAAGLAAVQTGARAVLDGGGISTPTGRQRFRTLDRLCATRGLSPGGAGDLLAATLFLAALDDRSSPICRP
jgi:triphosphoribosyl-dephospho-CoA synthase